MPNCDVKNDEHQGLHDTGRRIHDDERDVEVAIWSCQCGARTLTRDA